MIYFLTLLKLLAGVAAGVIYAMNQVYIAEIVKPPKSRKSVRVANSIRFDWHTPLLRIKLVLVLVTPGNRWSIDKRSVFSTADFVRTRFAAILSQDR